MGGKAGQNSVLELTRHFDAVILSEAKNLARSAWRYDAGSYSRGPSLSLGMTMGWPSRLLI